MYQPSGAGLLNTVINKLPFELHLPGYQFCGPGTKLKKRLARGDIGVNQLDSACKLHDIAYSQHKNLEDRHSADKQLEYSAWDRVKSKDAGFGEKAAAWFVTNAIKAKRKLGMGVTKKKTFKKRVRKTAFRKAIVDKIKMSKFYDDDDNDLKTLSKNALKAARVAVKNVGGLQNVRMPRIIPIPKTGGFLPLIPLFAGLSALGALAGGAGGIAKAVNDAKSARQELAEKQRHNKSMESIELGKKGSGLYLKKHRSGMGLYLKKQKN